jgi:hypothetical protein
MLDPMVQIPSGFHSSQIRHSHCRYAHVLGTPNSPIPDVLLSRALAPSGYTMVHVTVNIRPRSSLSSGFRHFKCHHTHVYRIPDPRFSDDGDQRSRYHSYLTAVITSQNRISRFRSFYCSVFLTYQSPDCRCLC